MIILLITLNKYKKGGLTPPNATGSKCINDGINQIKLRAGLEIPDSWYRGRLSMIGKNNPMKNKKTAKLNANLRKKN